MSNYGDFKVNLGAVANHIIPASHEQVDLGHSTAAFRDLYLSGSTLHLGGAQLNSVGSAVLLPAGTTVGGSPIQTEASSGGVSPATAIAYSIALG